MQGYKVALSQIRYVLVPQLPLQMDIIHPCSLQAVQYFKEYCFFRARSARFYFCYFTRSYGGEHFAYFARFSYGGEKGIISTAYFIPTAKIHLPFRRNFQRLVRVFANGVIFPRLLSL